jgi:hypothetical protein
MEVDIEQISTSVSTPTFWSYRPAHYLIESPLILNYSRALAIADGVEDKELLTSVVLYNMALVNHCQTIELRSSLLSISLNLYKKMAASVLESTKMSMSWYLLAIWQHGTRSTRMVHTRSAQMYY